MSHEINENSDKRPTLEEKVKILEKVIRGLTSATEIRYHVLARTDRLFGYIELVGIDPKEVKLFEGAFEELGLSIEYVSEIFDNDWDGILDEPFKDSRIVAEIWFTEGYIETINRLMKQLEESGKDGEPESESG